MLISKTTICRFFGIGKKDHRIEKLEHQTYRKILDTCFKNIDNGRSESLGIDYKKLVQGAIIGSAILYDIKQYKKKTEREKDRNKHYADIKNLVPANMDL